MTDRPDGRWSTGADDNIVRGIWRTKAYRQLHKIRSRETREKLYAAAMGIGTEPLR